MFSSIHSSIGVFLRCNFFYVSLSLHCIILTVAMHVCCVIFNKVSVSVNIYTGLARKWNRRVLRRVRVDPPKRFCRTFWGSATSCGGQTPLTPPSNTALVKSELRQAVLPMPRPTVRHSTVHRTKRALILHRWPWSCNRRFIQDLDLVGITAARTDRYANSSLVVFENVMIKKYKRVNKLLIHFYFTKNLPHLN